MRDSDAEEANAASRRAMETKRKSPNGDFQFIEFSLVPIEWIQKMYPDSWEKFQLRGSDEDVPE